MVLAFNVAYGVAGEGSMAGTWRRPTILGTEQVKQSRRGPSAAPSGLSLRQGVTILPPKRNLVPRFRVKLLIETGVKG